VADVPLSYWRLDEATGTTAKDERARNPGTYTSGPLLGRTGLLGEAADKAIHLDGTNDRVSIPNTSGLSLTTSLTLEAWIRPSFLPANGSFASVLSKPEAYPLQFNGPLMEFTVIQNGTRRRLQAPAGTVKAGAVSHVVGTYDGARQRLYVNGVEVANRAQTGAASVSSYTLNVGSWNGTGEYFGGDVDEVAVYDKTLTSARVSAHYAAGAPRTVTAFRVQPRRRTKPAQAATRRAVLRKLAARRGRRTKVNAWISRASLEPLCHLERRDKRRLEATRVTWLRG
jgi:concanavalin A-like lectin/glucanase superfamily protein